MEEPVQAYSMLWTMRPVTLVLLLPSRTRAATALLMRQLQSPREMSALQDVSFLTLHGFLPSMRRTAGALMRAALLGVNVQQGIIAVLHLRRLTNRGFWCFYDNDVRMLRALLCVSCSFL